MLTLLWKQHTTVWLKFWNCSRYHVVPGSFEAFASELLQNLEEFLLYLEDISMAGLNLQLHIIQCYMQGKG